MRVARMSDEKAKILLVGNKWTWGNIKLIWGMKADFWCFLVLDKRRKPLHIRQVKARPELEAALLERFT